MGRYLDDKDNNTSKVETVAKTALAISAGAVLFYRGGGDDLLSKQYNSIKKAGKELTRDILSTSRKDLDYDSISKSVKKAFLSDNSTYKKALSEDLKLSPYRSKGAMGALLEYYDISKNRNSILTKKYNSEMIMNPFREKWLSNYTEKDHVNISAVERFMEDALRNPSSMAQKSVNVFEDYIVPKEGILNKYFKNTTISLEDQNEMFQDFMNKIKNKENDFGKYAESSDEFIDNLLSKINGRTLAKEFGSKNNGNNFVDKMLNDNRATFNELIKAKKDGKLKDTTLYKRDKYGHVEAEDFLSFVETLIEKDDRIGNIYADNFIRIDKNNNIKIYSGLEESMDVAEDKFSNTIFGKLAKSRDRYLEKRVDTFSYFNKGNFDPILASIEGSNNKVINHDYVKVLNNLYRVENDSLVKIDEDLKFISSEHGFKAKMINSLAGNVDRSLKETNKLSKKLGLFESPEGTFVDDLKGFKHKFNDKNYMPNFIDTIKAYTKEDDIFDIYSEDELYDNLLNFQREYNKSLELPSNKVLEKLYDAIGNKEQNILKYALATDEELLENLNLIGNPNNFINKDLSLLIKSGNSNIKSNINNANVYISKEFLNSTSESLSYSDRLRKEIIKEVLVSKIDDDVSPNTVLNLIDNIQDISSKDKKLLRKYAHIANFQDKTDIFSVNSLTTEHDLVESIRTALSFFGTTNTKDGYDKFSSYTNDFIRDADEVIKKNHSVFETENILEIDKARGNSKYITSRKGISPLDLIKNINSKTKDDGLYKKFGKQFVAGRDNFENVTEATLAPYYMLFRLQEPLSKFGINMSSKDMSNTMDLAKNIMLKRILPVAGAFTACSYLDYRMDAYTGMGITESLLSAHANMEIGNAKFKDALGITEHAKIAKDYNPIADYLNIDDKTEEEKRDYYINGYDPVRKSRHWLFGSSSEFRGGKINYFKPSALRAVTSDYKDISVFGSEDEKWAHSWIPTPRHPLSTLRRLANPYYLEEKHYWDRPYMASAPLFEENTPWGVLLNPTIGNIIKPEKRMHRMETGNGIIDVRDIIAKENEKIKDRGKSLIEVKDGEFSIKDFKTMNPYFANDSATNYIGDGDGSSLEQDISGIPDNYDYQNSTQVLEIPQIDNNISDNVSGKILISTPIINKIALGHNANVLTDLAMINNTIKQKAAGASPKGLITLNAGYEKLPAKYSKQILQNKEDAADIRNSAKGMSSIDNALYSMTELGGMYGFIGESIFGGKENKLIENASNINSFTRNFWNMEIGGFGGEIMEISRRFIPHENRNIKRINNIRNTMPEWLPNSFKHGDPYTKVTNGEGRLPGAGYEALYDLHPDKFGPYGAYDRFKILADVAPFSNEYKVWKKIAKKTLAPGLEEDYKKVLDRVDKQSTNHSFYDYKTKGKKFENIYGTIATIDRNKFTIVGSDEIFSTAGLKMSKGRHLQEFIKPGEDIRIKYAADEYNRRDAQGHISAVIMLDGENINRRMEKEGAAEKRETDTSDAAGIYNLTASQVDKGKFFETISHLPIPYIHNKFLKIESPLESYKNEQIYGTPYASWLSPIESFLEPSFQTAFSRGLAAQSLGIGTIMLAKVLNDTGNKKKAILGKTIAALTNPAAFAGGMLAYLPTFKSKNILKGMEAGAAVGAAGYLAVNSHNPIFSATFGTGIGAALGKQFFHNGKAGAAIGLGTGIVVSALQNHGFDKEKMFNKYIPKDTKEKWEIEEYYDRLEYMKYIGLFNKAAELAKSKENVDIKNIIEEYENEREKKRKLKAKMMDLKQYIEENNSPNKSESLKMINNYLSSISEQNKMFEGGEYTKSAIAYYRAAKSTIYGIDEYSSISDVLRSIPKYDIDFFMEFAKENNPKKQKKILKYVSPYERKALNLLWGNETEALESNSDYFSKNYLPNMFWGGWHNNVDLEYVKMKTIENEGLRLADFGIYESKKDDASYKSSPSVNRHYEPMSALSIQANISTVLKGAGLRNVEVKIEENDSGDMNVFTNITKSESYRIKEKINNIFGRSYY